jgi:filamentous hemagglutinin family protein
VKPIPAFRTTGSSFRRLGVLAVFAGALLTISGVMSVALAAPSGGTIVGGSGSINTSGLTTTIHQNTQSQVINWHSYNVNANETVNYLQPNTSAISLNRILSNNASQIFWQINANGQVVLVNPNGIFFGNTASVNVGGLIASGLDISPSDFMNGDYFFNKVIGSDGSIINSGLINASLGRNIALIGKQVSNEGVISAQLRSISLTAGKGILGTH